MEESWERCPYCEAEKQPPVRPGENGVAAASDAVQVVPKKEREVRRLAGWLVEVGGEREDQDYRVHAGRSVIGKGSRSDIVIKDAYLSERHAVLESGSDGYLLTDLESKHGTFINGKRVAEPRRLRDGDRIRLGNTEVKFRSFETG